MRKILAVTGGALVAALSPAVAHADQPRDIPACWGQLNIAGRDQGAAIEWGGLYTCEPVAGGDYDATWNVTSDGAVIASGKFQPQINDQQAAFPVTPVDLPNPVPNVAKHVKVSVTFNAPPPSKAPLSTERDVTYDPEH